MLTPEELSENLCLLNYKEPAEKISPSKKQDSIKTDPKVLISGAGIAGLFLANLLEKANIPYEIFERSKQVLPLGSTILLTASVLPAFEQLGLYEDLLKISSPTSGAQLYDGEMKVIGNFSAINHKNTTGYDVLLTPRSELHSLLLSRVPSEKIYMGKKILSFLQNKQGVMIRLQDGTTVHGGVLVGADGVSSAVRQQLYRDMKKNGRLAPADDRSLQKGFLCLVGTSDPLDLAQYPGIDEPKSHCSVFVGDKSSPYSWVLFSVPGNRICWSVISRFESEGSSADQHLNSEWSSITTESMVKYVHEFKTPFGKLGDLIKKTPQNRISQGFMGDIVYQTWEYSRTVLIGDAAHQMFPVAGQSAVSAIEDAIVLANCLHESRPESHNRVREALTNYYKQRFNHVKSHQETSRTLAILQFGHTIKERAIRHAVFSYLPKSVQKKHTGFETQDLQTVSFLPIISNQDKNQANRIIPRE